VPVNRRALRARRAASPQQRRPLARKLIINPRFAARLAAHGLTTARAILDLSGEVVSGHPDRHVVRVELPGWGRALYLKRQHRVGWRERLRQRLAGFGRVSRCEREARVVRDLEANGFPCPEWVAYGEDARGRAFLLVEELADAEELRRLLSDNQLSLEDRKRIAERLGQAVAELHAAGFDTPDLTAKHVFTNPESFAVTLIDWQSARRVTRLTVAARLRSLAALGASLAGHLASRADRLRFLWAYQRVSRRTGLSTGRFSALARRVAKLSALALCRRSVRDQRQPVVTDAPQRLVWLAGEAVCAVPAVAAVWPRPTVAAPFYDAEPGLVHVRLADGRVAELVRGRSFAPVGRLVAFLRGRPWRSPGATLGRVLFHLQRYGVPAPQLFAFGQRLTGRTTADWFALYEPPADRPLADWLAAPAPLTPRGEVLEQVGSLLRQLHDAGCRYTGSGPLFWVADEPEGRVTVGGVRSVRIVKRLTERARRRDLSAILDQLPGATRTDHQWVIRGYERGGGPGGS
jgi:tRNA A-37 threonylcarbamoyl transferase component Bud32